MFNDYYVLKTILSTKDQSVKVLNSLTLSRHTLFFLSQNERPSDNPINITQINNLQEYENIKDKINSNQRYILIFKDINIQNICIKNTKKNHLVTHYSGVTALNIVLNDIYLLDNVIQHTEFFTETPEKSLISGAYYIYFGKDIGEFIFNHMSFFLKFGFKGIELVQDNHSSFLTRRSDVFYIWLSQETSNQNLTDILKTKDEILKIPLNGV